MARLIFVAGFFLLLAVPALQLATHLVPLAPIDENRNLAPPPTRADFASIAGAEARFDAWFNDHFGFRALLIRSKTQIDFSLFHTSAKVQIGKHGWLFYRDVMDFLKTWEDDYYRNNGEAVVDNLVALRDALAAKRMVLIVTVNLLADRFVPQELPATIPNPPRNPAVDRFLANLAARLGPSYLDMTQVMRTVMAQRPAFHKTDYHWNEPAAFVAAQAIAERAAALTGRPAPRTDLSFDIVQRRWTGGIGMQMPLFVYPTENALFLRDSHLDIPGFARTWTDPVFAQRYRSTTDNPALLPPMALIGDSFSQNLQVSGIAASFQQTAMARWGKPHFSDYIKALPPATTILVLQFMEVSTAALPILKDQPDFALALHIIGQRSAATMASAAR